MGLCLFRLRVSWKVIYGMDELEFIFEVIEVGLKIKKYESSKL